MKKFRLVVFILTNCILLSFCIAQPLRERYADYLTPPPFYPCAYTKVAPVIDGVLDDAVWETAQPITQLHDIQGDRLPLPSLQTEIRMLWDSTALYVAARLSEPYVRATLSRRDDIVWHENDFEVFLDPDGDGIHYYEIEINAIGTLLDLQMSHPYRSGGHFFSAWDCPGIERAVKVEGLVNDSTGLDTAWTMEMKIPHRALSIDFSDALQQSRLWRMNFSRVEWLHEGGPEENWVWAPTGEINIHMPERWGYVYLLPEGINARTDVGEPAALTDSLQGFAAADYQLLWMLFYEQLRHYSQHRSYIGSIAEFGLTSADLSFAHIPEDDPRIAVYTTPYGFELSLRRKAYTLLIDQRGHFRCVKGEGE